MNFSPLANIKHSLKCHEPELNITLPPQLIRLPKKAYSVAREKASVRPSHSLNKRLDIPGQ